MLEDCKTAQERWGGVHDMIDRLLAERRALVEVWQPLKAKPSLTTDDTAKVQSLCELLVDYVSAGHFALYEQLALEAQDFHDDKALRLLNRLLPEIDTTTQLAIEFNDKFDTPAHCSQQLEDLPFSLQALCAVMSERFTYEDQLIKELHDVHSEKAV